MKVLIVGLPYFTKYLVNKLKAKYPQFTFIALNTYYSKSDKLKFLLHIWNCDVIHSINGSLEKSFVFDLSILLHRKLIFHWVGSDLYRAVQIANTPNSKPKYIKYPIHLTDTPWYVNELSKIQINSEFVPLKGFNKEQKISDFPSTFSVLTYIGNSNPEFYGINELIIIAECLSEVNFYVVGLESYKKPLPSNIYLLGWVDNMQEKIENSVVCLRMPKTDGLAFFVLEALYFGRYVAYNQEFESSEFCKNTQEFINYIYKLKTEFDSKKLQPNYQIAAKILNDFDEEIILENIIKQYLK